MVTLTVLTRRTSVITILSDCDLALSVPRGPCLFIVYYCFPPFLTFLKSCGALLQTNSHCIMQSPLRLEEHVRSQQDVRGITSHFSTAGMFPQLIFFLKKQTNCSFIEHRVKTVLRKSFFLKIFNNNALSTKVQKLHIESVSDSFQSAVCEYLKPCS